MSKHQMKAGAILSDRGLPASTVRGPAAILGTGRMARGLARRLAGTLPGGIVLGSRDTGRAAEVAAALNHADISGGRTSPPPHAARRSWFWPCPLLRLRRYSPQQGHWTAR